MWLHPLVPEWGSVVFHVDEAPLSENIIFTPSRMWQKICCTVYVLYGHLYYVAGDHHLALLLAQACLGQEAPRQLMSQQLSNWAEGETDAFMAPARLALYSLLAAAPTHHASHTTVNTCRGLDWRRAFALHLWWVPHYLFFFINIPLP